jgi:hypothetical protein
MGARNNVVPFERPRDPLAYAPGVPPFDRHNPVHVQAWNAMYAFGQSELRARERGEREGR